MSLLNKDELDTHLKSASCIADTRLLFKDIVDINMDPIKGLTVKCEILQE